MTTRDYRADHHASSSYTSCSPMLEQLEPRLLLDSDPFMDASAFHHENEWLDIGIGDTYTEHYTAPTWGSIDQLTLAKTFLAGTKGIGAQDAVYKQFSVPTDGDYSITFSGHTSGDVYIVSSSLVGNAKGGGNTKLEARILNVGGTTVEELLYETERSLGDVFGDVKDTWDVLTTIIGGQLPGEAIADEIIDAFAAVSTPVATWSDQPFSLTTTSHLESGSTYTWGFSLISSVDSIAALNACNATSLSLNADLDEVEIIHLDASSPRIDSFFYTGSPNPVVQGGNLLLSASASDPDGSVDRVEFYRDANGNGVLEAGDEYVGSDSSPQGGEWTWYGEARWSPGIHKFFAKARDNEGQWSSPSSIFVTIGSSPAQPGTALSLLTRTWNDPAPDGDSDSLPEPGETVELEVKLRNNSGQDVEDVEATLVCNLSNIQISDATDNYGTILAGEDEWGHNDYHMFLDVPDPVGVTFTLNVTYTQGGTRYFQDITFDEGFPRVDNVVVPHQVVVYDAAPNGDGDGIPESGEYPRFDLYLRNSSPNGSSSAMNVQARIVNTNVGQVRDSWEYYPDLYGGGGTPQKQYGMFMFSGSPIPWSYAGPVTADIEIMYDGLSESVLLDDYLLFNAQPDAWFRLEPGQIDFGITGTDQDVTRTVTIRNFGSESLQVSNIVTSDPDTTIQELASDPLPWTIPAGGTKDITAVIETSALQGLIERVITVTTDARTGGPDDIRVVITGLVSDMPPVFQVPGAAPLYEHVDISGDTVVWAEYRDGSVNIYGYDLTPGSEFPICTDPGDQWSPKISGSTVVWQDGSSIYSYNIESEQRVLVTSDARELIGVDNGKIAFTQVYSEPFPGRKLSNIYLYDVSTEVSTNISNFSAAGPMHTVEGMPLYDFGGSVLVWAEVTYLSSSGSTDARLKKLEVGVDSSPIRILSEDLQAVAANDGKVAISRRAASRNQVWVWDGSWTAVTPDDTNRGTSNIGVYTDAIVYRKSGSSGLFMWGLPAAANSEAQIYDQSVSSYSLRMDGNLAVWNAGGSLYYLFLNQADISITSPDIVIAPDDPVEGSTVDATVAVHNIAPWEAQGDIVVRLYDGDPDTGGTQWGSDHVISGGLAVKGNSSVTFGGLTVPIGWEGSRDIYARVSIPGGDNPINNKASKSVNVLDSDTDGPVISNVAVVEHNGDGDGIVGADEQIRISWELTDPGGIGSVELLEDGNPVALDGDYYTVIDPLDADGFDILEHDFVINATDADNSPVSSQYTGSFDVVPAEEITVLYGTQSMLDGETIPIDFGEINRGTLGVSNLFIVRNDGEQTLTLGAISVPAGFSVTGPAETAVLPGASTYFTVTLNTGSIGVFTGEVSLANSDGPISPDGLGEDPFGFAVTGSVVDNIVPWITSWGSAADHGALGEVVLPIPDDGTFSDPRNGGIQTLLVEFSEAIDPASFTPASVQIAGIDIDGVDVGLSGIGISTSTRNGDTVGVIEFSDTLPDVARYIVRVEGVTDAAGNPLVDDNDRIMTALIGDAWGDLRVNNTDLGAVRFMRDNGPDPLDPTDANAVRTDVWTDGSINNTDFGGVRFMRDSGHDARFIPDPVLPVSSEGASVLFASEGSGSVAPSQAPIPELAVQPSMPDTDTPPSVLKESSVSVVPMPDYDSGARTAGIGLPAAPIFHDRKTPVERLLARPDRTGETQASLDTELDVGLVDVLAESEAMISIPL